MKSQDRPFNYFLQRKVFRKKYYYEQIIKGPHKVHYTIKLMLNLVVK